MQEVEHNGVADAVEHVVVANVRSAVRHSRSLRKEQAIDPSLV